MVNNDLLEVRCPECGINVARLPPCRVCGHRWGCCPCVHAEEPHTNMVTCEHVPMLEGHCALCGEWLPDYPEPCRGARCLRCGGLGWIIENDAQILCGEPPPVFT